MVDWHRFTPSDFEHDFERDELAQHGVTFDEAVECFFADFQIRRNKKYRDRHQLLGRALGGRKLKTSLPGGHYEEAPNNDTVQTETDSGSSRSISHGPSR